MARVRKQLSLIALLLASVASLLASPVAFGEQPWIADAVATL